MYEVKVRDNLFIAHSLDNEFFGPAKNLHGATYVIDLIISSKELSNMNSLDKIGQYQFVHNDNNISIRKSSNEMTPGKQSIENII